MAFLWKYDFKLNSPDFGNKLHERKNNNYYVTNFPVTSAPNKVRDWQCANFTYNVICFSNVSFSFISFAVYKRYDVAPTLYPFPFLDTSHVFKIIFSVKNKTG